MQLIFAVKCVDNLESTLKEQSILKKTLDYLINQLPLGQRN